ncbi:MAG: phosphoglucosamine mutase [Flavobacteriales bacterium]|nr:phosphoglucosamine mutase [Flavobacteriales bacterium]
MTLIKSISGIRGTIGGKSGDNLTPIDIVKFAAAYGSILQTSNGKKDVKVVIGRDARKSGPMVRDLVSTTLVGMGMEVIDLGLSTTPTVEIAVPEENAHGGIIITASHNPGQWNALKLLNEEGEFISAEAGQKVISIADALEMSFAEIDAMGSRRVNESYLHRHIELVLNHPLVDKEAIAQANFKVAIDAVNSSGGIFVPALLQELGVASIEKLFCTPNGDFPHNPEPLPEHLTDLSSAVVEKGCNLGIIVDPDVDRLAFVSEDGNVFGEEYTLVAVADYVLSREKGNTVSNLSSTRALRDVTEKRGGKYYASAVGEVNVVQKMREVNAVIGGEGNGGIIDPKLHYGRDALIGIGLFLTHLAKSGKKMSELRNAYPSYFMSKNKIQLTASVDVDAILEKVAAKYDMEEVNTVDGVKIDFPDEWVHLRKSNTEPIIRLYTESKSPEAAEDLAHRVMAEIGTMIS